MGGEARGDGCTSDVIEIGGMCVLSRSIGLVCVQEQARADASELASPRETVAELQKQNAMVELNSELVRE